MRLRTFSTVVATMVLAAVVVAPAVTAKAPKVGAKLSAQASISPLEDFVQFNGGASSKSRACTIRTVEIRRPAGNVLLDSFTAAGAVKAGKLWSSTGSGEYHQMDGYVTRGETLLAIAPKKKLKKGGRVTAVCKPLRTSFTVPLPEG